VYDTITIKIGSNVLASDGGGLNEKRVSELVDEIANLHKEGKKIILVSSGAVASGRGILQVDSKMDQVSQRQLLSSVGQVKLINLYASLFEKHKINVGQVLVTKEDFRTRGHYLNMKNCLSALWDNNVLPIVNENDAVSVTALMFTDNDELSGMMAAMMDCEALYILSNIDGIFNGNPTKEGVEVIRQIQAGKTDLAKYISTSKSNFGRGGMLTKCRIARKTAASGIQVHIANGLKPNILTELTKNSSEVVHTHFIGDQPSPAIKKWMAYSEGFTKAEIVINKGAIKALYSSKATSVLLAGVTAINGQFKKGDLLKIMGEDGHLLGIGKAKYDRENAEKHMNDPKYKPLIHYDYLFVFPEIM